MLILNAFQGQRVNILIKEPEVKKITCHLTNHANYLLSGALAKDTNKSLKEFTSEIVSFPGTLGTETRWNSPTRGKQSACKACGFLVLGWLTATTPRGVGRQAAMAAERSSPRRLRRCRIPDRASCRTLSVAGVSGSPSRYTPLWRTAGTLRSVCGILRITDK